ncbi:extracellular solute-binding protein [Amorphus orientalis]|uniref:Peptide/nickel transport system substrate-binding protein n=1 Tax=Amorphus orientalis TaxID=649198 RepID=A0AAE3VN85_9HYPH|nr:extracellular solute-binding protein [Amorphus orientalis]MDQ0315669.1 peptide/nickel transport system substrate-binding protein [Amorphus orientalis]
MPTSAPHAGSVRRLFPALALAVSVVAGMALPAEAEPGHGIAMHGAPALPADFEHLPYANPDAPKGGVVTYGVLGSFDSLNPFIARGEIAVGLRDPFYGNNVYESLLERNRDEPFSLYGLLAERVEMPEDRNSITFFMNPEARFSDGEPVTVDDVIFSFELLRDKGRPNHRTYYRKVDRIERVGDAGVRFVFSDTSDRELPLILGLMPVLPQHAIDRETFDRTTLDPPVGSGPYTVATVDPGKRLVLKRDADYWGRDLPINRGRFNFDTMRFDYFRDQSSQFEAFKKGLLDAFLETDPTRWATGYEFPAVAAGDVVPEKIRTETPRGMFAFAFNTRRSKFQDPRVREALGYLFDFPWINANLLHGQFDRTASYFQNSELASTGRPASAHERDLLAPYPDAVRDDILEGTWRPPQSDGSGRDRTNMREALALFREAGYGIENGRLINQTTGEPLAFEILVTTREDERLALAYQRLVKPVGITINVRYVDSAQYQARLQSFDFDVIRAAWPSSLSPGNEQLYRWSSLTADAQGSFNYTGASDPAIDAMIQEMLAARTREDFVNAVRALDRVLLSGFYVLPLYHSPDQWIARWSRIQHPDEPSLTGAEPDTWWAKAAE